MQSVDRDSIDNLERMVSSKETSEEERMNAIKKMAVIYKNMAMTLIFKFKHEYITFNCLLS